MQLASQELRRASHPLFCRGERSPGVHPTSSVPASLPRPDSARPADAERTCALGDSRSRSKPRVCVWRPGPGSPVLATGRRGGSPRADTATHALGRKAWGCLGVLGAGALPTGWKLLPCWLLGRVASDRTCGGLPGTRPLAAAGPGVRAAPLVLCPGLSCP